MSEDAALAEMKRACLTLDELCEVCSMKRETVLKLVRTQGAPCYTTDPTAKRRTAKPALLRFDFDRFLTWLRGFNEL